MNGRARDVRISPLGLAGNLQVPARACSVVAFVHGSGSSRLSPRNRAVASALNGRGIATLLFDLLSPDEEAERANVFDIPLLANRLVDAGFVQVTTPTVMAGGHLQRMGIDKNHLLFSQIFWLDDGKCLRPMLAPHLGGRLTFRVKPVILRV